MPTWRVGLSADLRAADGTVSWGDIGLGELTAAGVGWEFLRPDDGELTAAHVAGYDAILFAAPSISAATVSGPDGPALLARFGVGLDAVDLPACTAAGVAVSITPDGARRAVATAALTMILALEHQVLAKDRLVREGRWQDRMSYMGRGLSGRRVGVLGLGNIAFELFGLLHPFGTENLASDPFRSVEEAAEAGVRLVDLETLMSEADIIVITAGLTPETYHLIDADMISRMRADAVLINIARGPIVDTAALVEALSEGRIRGAGLDVFELEPLPSDHPLTALENVVLSPHSLAWTDELALGNGGSAIRAILDLRGRRVPSYLANPEVASHPAFAARLDPETP
jgi:phosphoglycerate dehydrogenase-like enzyme